MSSVSSDIFTTYSQDERITKYLEDHRNEALKEDYNRKYIFEQIFAEQELPIFKIVGLNIIKLSYTKIKFCFQPALIYAWISQQYIFYCSLRYLERYKKWIIKREPMPARPLVYKVTSKTIFINDDLIELCSVILKIYAELRKWSEDEIRYRRAKYEQYKAGNLCYLDIDSIDEELYFSDNERQALAEKRETVLKRMLPPDKKRTKKRKQTKLKYKI